MSTLDSEVFEAFKAIGVEDSAALRAATALNRRDSDVADIKRDNTVIKWMLGTVGALLISSQVALWLKLADVTAQLATVAAKMH